MPVEWPWPIEDEVFFFAVGTPEAMHSGVWAAWTNGDDLYIAEMASGGVAHKLSVHASGICRLATIKTRQPGDMAPDWKRDSDPRVMQRWNIAKTGTVDLALCATFIVPTVYIPKRFALPRWLSQRQRERITWVEPAPLMAVTLVEFVRTRTSSPDLLPSDWPEDSARLLATLDHDAGPRVWCYRRQQAMSHSDLTHWQGLVGKTVISTTERVPEGEVFPSFLSHGEDWVTPCVVEMALGPGNIQQVGASEG